MLIVVVAVAIVAVAVAAVDAAAVLLWRPTPAANNNDNGKMAVIPNCFMNSCLC